MSEELPEVGTPPMPETSAAAPEPVAAAPAVEEPAAEAPKPRRARKPAASKPGGKVVVMINPDLPVQNPIYCPSGKVYLYPQTPSVIPDDDWARSQLRAKGLILAD